MKKLLRYRINIMVILAAMLFPAAFSWSAVTIQDISKADVTSSGFAIVWQASGSTTPGISIYSDPAGNNEITSQLEVIPYPLYSGNPGITGEYEREESMESLRSQAGTKGLMKVSVAGCLPETTYYYRIFSRVDGGEVAQWPSGALSSVTTTRENVFISDSKQMLVTIDNKGGAVDPYGWMVIAYSSENPFGVSSYVGDGAGADQAYVNLSNLFAADGINWKPSGSRDIVIEVRSGIGAGIIYETFPLNFSDNFSVSAIYPVTAGEPVVDTDNDGIPDDWETLHGLDPSDPSDALLDNDSDGLTNLEEYQNRTDPNDPDTDGDGLSDGWEVAGGLNPLDDGSIDPGNGPDGDPDNDGSTNIEELGAGSAPMNGDSLPVNIDIMLHSGFNIFGYPVSASTSSYDLLSMLGDDSEIEKIMVYDKASGSYKTTWYEAASPAGDDVAVGYGDGIIVYSKADKTASFNPSVHPGNSYIECVTVDLNAGLNVVTFPCVPAGISGYQLLQAIGDDTIVSSLQRYNKGSGLFETAFYHNGQPAGVDFPLAAGEGYLLYMKQARSGFRP